MGGSVLGHSPADISKALNINDSTVRRTLRMAPLRHEGESLPRPGRNVTYTERTERLILRHVRLNPKDEWKDVLQALQLKIKKRTYQRILAKHHIAKWRAKKRPFLTERVADLRYNWCKVRKDWKFPEFACVMWSDECSAERGAGKSAEWVFRTPSQKWDKEMIQTYNKSHDISVMIWGCFWYKDGAIHPSDLYLLDRDFASKKFGYSAQSYLEVLEDQMPRCWEPGLTFMQDGAPIHTARTIRNWFQEMGIPLIDWPPYSPDLNPIEHIWFHLKKKVLQMHPELVGSGKSEEAIEALGKALIEAWDALPDSLFLSCLESMEKRRDAVLAAKGWHTKY
jgi:hypothetical protein